MGNSKLVSLNYNSDHASVIRAINKLASSKLGPGADPTFAGMAITGTLTVAGAATFAGSVSITGALALDGLTADRLVFGNSSKELTSTDLASWVTGTANRVTVTDDADGTITLSAPQDIHTGATPTFAGLTLSGLTGSRLMATSAGSVVESTDLTSWVAGTSNQVNVTDDADGTITLSTPQDIHTGATPTFAGLISTGIVQATGFAKTGWPLSPGVTLSFDNGTRTLTVTDGGSAYYYINGVKYTLGGNKTVVIDDTEGEWFIYFSGDTLTASQIPWVINDDDKALVAILYWDATNNVEIITGYELHSYVMDSATHSRLHHAGGAAWESGLLASDAGSETVNVSAGDFHDEDIEITISDGAGGSLWEQVLSPAELPVYYRSGASDWRKVETASKANATDAGYVSGTDLQYNLLSGTWSSAPANVAKYVAYYVVGTNDISEPVALIMGQREDNTLALARENNVFSGLSLSGIPFTEMIVLARLILKETAGGVYYTLEDVTDLRATNSVGSIISPLITDHGGLAGLADDDHAQYLLVDGTRAMTGAIDLGDFGMTNGGNLECVRVEDTDADTYLAVESSADVDKIEGYTAGTKTLEIDAVGIHTLPQSSSASAKVSANTALTTGSFQIIPYNSENWDNRGEFDSTTNYRFTATVAGIYIVTTQSLFELSSPNINDQMGVSLYKGGSLHQIGAVERVADTNVTNYKVSSNYTVKLAVGEYIDHRYFASSGGVIQGNGTVYYTHISITKVQ